MVSAGVVGTVTIFLYLAVILALGYKSWGVGELNTEDWVTADRKLGIVVLMFTYAASYHSASAFLGVGGFGYTHGVAFFGIVFTWIAVSAVLLWFLGTRL